MFHVERCIMCLAVRRGTLRLPCPYKSALGNCSRWNRDSFESSKIDLSEALEGRYADNWAFLAPTSRNLRSEFGIAIGSCHSQSVDFRTSSKSRPPTQRTTLPAATRSDPAQLRNDSNSPNAREQT